MNANFLDQRWCKLLLMCSFAYWMTSVTAMADTVQTGASHWTTTERHELQSEALQACSDFGLQSPTPINCQYHGTTSTGVFYYNSNYSIDVETDPKFYFGYFYFCPAGSKYFKDVATCVVLDRDNDDSPPRENGPCCPYLAPTNVEQPKHGEPIVSATGNMWHVEQDYSGGPESTLSIARTYNSSTHRIENPRGNLFGPYWTSHFDSVLYAAVPFITNKRIYDCYRRRDNQELVCFERPRDGSSPPVSVLPQAVGIVTGNGGDVRFNRVTDLEWETHSDNRDKLTPLFSQSGGAHVGWSYLAADTQITKIFDATGRLLSITSPTGARLRLTYATSTNDTSIDRTPADAPICDVVSTGAVLPGRPACVTDDFGRQLTFEYRGEGQITKIIDPAGGQYQYAYDGPTAGCPPGAEPDSPTCMMRNLTSVTYPDGKTRKYHYNEAARINNGTGCSGAISVGTGYHHTQWAMTGLTDENGARHITWTYDCKGRATSSERAGGLEKVVLTYGSKDVNGNSTTTMQSYYGNPATPQWDSIQFNNKEILGVMKNVSVSHVCPSCGPFKTRTYDSSGNDLLGTDWAGVSTKFQYNYSRNLQLERIDAFGTALARTISTAWHSTLRRRVSSAEPRRITTYTYDTAGNLLTRSVQATSDANGSQGINATAVGTPRTWTYTYNNRGQVLTARGPRTDTVELTTYTYDSISGAVASVTNAVGHAATFINDIHGRPESISTGTTTVTLAYTNRGWLSSRTVTAGAISETTTYDYDGVGLLKSVTNPDTSTVTFIYNDAHHLTSISDSRGNTITYDLDLRGKKLAERSTDPNGVLASQIKRAFNGMGQVVKVTGAAE